MSEAKCIMHIPYLAVWLSYIKRLIIRKKKPTETPTKKQEVTLTVL